MPVSQAGVSIFSYLDDRERTFDSPTDKFLLSAVNFAAEIERDKARQRTSDAMLRKAKTHHVASTVQRLPHHCTGDQHASWQVAGVARGLVLVR